MRTRAARLLLVALLAIVLLYAYARWPGGERPVRAARPAAAGRPVAPVASATPTPAARETPSPPSPRAEFSQAEPKSRPPAGAPQARRRPAGTTTDRPAGSDAARSGTAPGARVRIRPTTPRLTDYFETISTEIGSRWRAPDATERRGTGVPVVLKIARDGRVLWALVEGSSGDPAIDGSVTGLIEDLKRDGLPPLPDDYPYDELDIGLVLNAAGLR